MARPEDPHRVCCACRVCPPIMFLRFFCNKLVFILDFIIYIFFYLANIKILILFILFFCRKINVGSFALAAQRPNLFQCSELSLHVVLHLFPRCKGAGCCSDADVRTRSGTAVILACSLSYSTAPSGIAQRSAKSETPQKGDFVYGKKRTENTFLSFCSYIPIVNGNPCGIYLHGHSIPNGLPECQRRYREQRWK